MLVPLVLLSGSPGGADAGKNARSLQAEVEFCARTGLAEVGGFYPPDVFTYRQICDGLWVLHLLGALYMFLALSIVCDEFFVPALEVIVERFNISVRIKPQRGSHS